MWRVGLGDVERDEAWNLNRSPAIALTRWREAKLRANLRGSLPPADSGNEDATMASVAGWETTTVRIRRLDEELAAFPGRRFRLLKIDIEGHEHQALLGGKKALSEGLVENLLVEINSYWLKEQGSSASELWDYIISLGFVAKAGKPDLPMGELANYWFRHSTARR